MSAPMWFPLARTVNVGRGSGAMAGGEPRAVHHTTEGGSIDGAIATYRKTHAYPTFTIDYDEDDVVQHVAANVAATAVENQSGGVQTNKMGRYCIQIEWIGSATKPFTEDSKGNLKPAGPKVRAFFDWLRALGIPDVWPMGAPKAYPGSYGAKNGDRDAAVWKDRAGHYGHSQVPENHHGDPGAIDPSFVKQTAAAVEAHAAVDPTPIHQETCMRILNAYPDFPPVVLRCDESISQVTNAERAAYIAAGVPEVKLTKAQFKAISDRAHKLAA